MNVDRFVKLSWGDEVFTPDGHPTLYHYTSTETFTKILQNGKIGLRFSDYRYLNDASEGKYSLDLYHEVCKAMFSNDSKALEYFCKVRPSKKTLFLVKKVADEGNHHGIYGNREYQEFVCCFSKRRDSLPMWRGYLKDQKFDGCALGFYPTESLRELLRPEQNYENDNRNDSLFMSGNIHAIQVLYDREKQVETIEKYLSLCKEIYDVKEETDKESMRLFLEGFLALIKLAYKPSCFDYEEEIRLVYHRPLNLPDDQSPCIRYFPSHGFLIPNVILQCSRNSILRELVIAPLNESGTNPL